MTLLPNGYRRGSYHSATAPEPNSCRLMSFKSRCWDSPEYRSGRMVSVS